MAAKRLTISIGAAALAAGVLYFSHATLPASQCLTRSDVLRAQANSRDGISLSCNEAIRQAQWLTRQRVVAETETDTRPQRR